MDTNEPPLHFSTPEDVLQHAGNNKDFYYDSINCGLNRLRGSLAMLENNFGPDSEEIPNDLMVGAIWSLEGQADVLQKLIDMAWEAHVDKLNALRAMK